MKTRPVSKEACLFALARSSLPHVLEHLTTESFCLFNKHKVHIDIVRKARVPLFCSLVLFPLTILFHDAEIVVQKFSQSTDPSPMCSIYCPYISGVHICGGRSSGRCKYRLTLRLISGHAIVLHVEDARVYGFYTVPSPGKSLLRKSDLDTQSIGLLAKQPSSSSASWPSSRPGVWFATNLLWLSAQQLGPRLLLVAA